MVEDGIICIDKPTGMTSFGVVARVRRVLSRQAGRKVKVGHTGTLDPFASGLMILVVGKECRNAERYTRHDKWYEATVRLGASSTTGDPEGEITPVENAVEPPSSEVERVLAGFIGESLQQPPIFSALKVGGRRAYDLARKGETVELPKRPITIYVLECLEYEYPYLKIRTHVSSGTYIRSLAVGIGAALGTAAYCTALRRTQIAEYQVTEARQLSDFGVTD